MDKLLVLMIRHKMTEIDTNRMNGEGLIIYAIDEGMIGKDDVAKGTISDIKVFDNFASAKYISNGKETTLFYHFYKEEGVWKFDLTSNFKIFKVLLQNLAKKAGMSENDYILMLLEYIFKEKPTDMIWHPFFSKH